MKRTEDERTSSKYICKITDIRVCVCYTKF